MKEKLQVCFLFNAFRCAFFLVLFTTIFSFITKAQAISPHPGDVTYTPQGITISLLAEKKIENLMVIIIGPQGKLIFLENRYRFEGKFTRFIDLSNEPKGEYTVQIHKDQQVSKQTFNTLLTR